MKNPAILHGAWLAVAAGAYFTGSQLQKAKSSLSSDGRPVKVAVGTGSTAAEQAGTMKVTAISKDSGIADFLSRYELGSGKPLSAERMSEAMSEALRETDPVKSSMLFARLLEELNPANAQASLDTLKSTISGMEMMRYMPLLAYQWGAVDSKSAFAAMDNEDPRLGMMGKTIALSGMASKDPAAAQAWLAEQKDLPAKDWFAQSMINGLVKSDLESALKFAAAQEEPDSRARSAETIAREKIKGGIDSAAAWADTLTDPDMKRGAAEAIAGQYTRTDPAKAAEYLKQFAAEEWAGRSIGDLAQTMAQKDPQKALDFAATVAGPGQARAYRSAIEEWTDKDATAASAYVNQMPLGDNRDAASYAVAREVAGDDPSAAIVWASSIGNEKQREEALIDVGRTYFREQPEAAAQWLAQSGLSAEAQQQVQQRGGRGGWGGPGGFPGGFGGGGPGRRFGR